MRKDKEKAFELRRQGKSYKNIASELKVPTSTLSNWFSGIDFSDALKSKLANEALDQNRFRMKKLNKERGLLLTLRYEQAYTEALHELQVYKDNALFVSAVVAYWGEGDKRSKNHIRITNTDPAMITLFRHFLEKICHLEKDKIKGALFIYKDLDAEECMSYWARETGIEQFYKTMVLPSKQESKKLPYGICTLVVSNTYLKKKMLVWIDQLPKMVLNTVSK